MNWCGLVAHRKAFTPGPRTGSVFRAGGYLAPFFACLALTLAGGPILAQESAESRAFKAATNAFHDGIYERAEREFAEYAQKFPDSPRLPEAILFQAQAALKQQKAKSAADLLTAAMPKAGGLADQYRYWLAEAQLENRNFQAAALAFARLIQDQPSSILLLEASYGEALARFKMKEWRQVAELLQAPGGSFRREALARPNDELAMRGELLLAEALFEQKDFPAAEGVLLRLEERDLIPEFKWRRQYLLCRVQIADQRLREALANTTNLLALATASGQRYLEAESVAVQAGILEQLSEFDAASQVYSNNLAEAMPAKRRREALLKIIELTLAQDRIGEAAQTLETFLGMHPEDAISDLALLTLGELHLKQHLAGAESNRTNFVSAPEPATNHLQRALAQFEQLTKKFTNSPLVGKAQLNKGWCLWEDGKIPESRAAFQAAVDRLPFSDDLAVARFKLGDAQFYQKDYTNALTSYRALTNDLARLPRSREAWFDEALYQILRACLEMKDLGGAGNAMQQIVQYYPASVFADRSMLLVGQESTGIGDPEKARQVFGKFLELAPGSPLLPEVELAFARSYVQERQWERAIAKYEEWLGLFPTNELRPRAEFDHAWVNYQAGSETNALVLFTNFVAQFPTHELAPRAQNWVADFFFRHQDYPNADKNYQILFQNTNWPVTRLSYQARMMAGRAAFARQVYKDAEKYFTDLINLLTGDTNSPPDLAAEAWLRLGDTLTQGSSLEARKPLDSRFGEAIVAFSKITQQFPTNRWAAQALGRIGDCHLQLASQEPKRYDQAIRAYQEVMDLPQAEVADRSRAEVGVALALEKQADALPAPENADWLRKSAFDHYYNIVCGKNLRDKEQPDPYCLKEAGLAAARLAEERKDWEVAVNIYERLSVYLPSLRPLLEKKIEKAQDQLRLEKN